MTMNVATARADPLMLQSAPLIAVGDAQEWETAGVAPPDRGDVMFVDIDDVTPELLRLVQPRVVLAAMLGRRFDCIDVGHKLTESGFDGCLRLIRGQLPRPEIVLSELREHFPGLQVQLGDPLRPVAIN